MSNYKSFWGRLYGSDDPTKNAKYSSVIQVICTQTAD